VILHFPHHSDAARSAVQRMPNLQQNSLLVSSPLMVPESENFDIAVCQRSFPGRVPSELHRGFMLKPIEFDREASVRAIEIQKIRIE
jgi:hypothetical protein